MSYAAAIDQLNSMTPELHTGAGQPRRKFSLEEVRILLHNLGDPHLQFRSVLIAGTNGKGSTASTLASILTVAGLHTGLYTSPHLERPNERIRLDGAEISDADFARLYFRVHETAETLVASGQLPQHPSYFEILTALAFLYYAEQHIDIAILEVGMGGRLDATNVVAPLLSVVTDISLDHTEWLGPTISAIAREKAGILRPHGTMVTLPQHPEANHILGEVATALDVRGINAAAYLPPTHESVSTPYTVEVLGRQITVDSPLAGAHQHRNIALAIATAVELAEHQGLPITAAGIAQGIRSTHWPGRLERIIRGPITWILDVAHNPAGAWALRAGLRTLLPEAPLPAMVFACLRDKPVTEMAQILFPLFDRVILAPLYSSRAASLEDLQAAAQLTGVPFTAATSAREALEKAARLVPGGAIVISGSVYLVGQARGILLGHTGSAA